MITNAKNVSFALWNHSVEWQCSRLWHKLSWGGIGNEDISTFLDLFDLFSIFKLYSGNGHLAKMECFSAKKFHSITSHLLCHVLTIISICPFYLKALKLPWSSKAIKYSKKIYETVIPHAFGFVRGSAILLLSYELYRRKKFKVWRLKYVPGAKGLIFCIKD